ncbi:MAG: phosphatidate cytidylyltransferase [Bacteroidales bacterium]|nr:phosphatidate cytidylyltransferase [Bacteroidales bacterium]
MKKFITRTLSGAVYVALIVAALYLGRWTNNKHLGLFANEIFFLLLTVVGIYEVYHNLAIKDIPTNRPWGYAMGILIFTVLHQGSSFLIPLLAFGILTIVQLFRHEEHPFETIGYTFLPVFWVAVPLSLIPMYLYEGKESLVMLLFILIWVNDSFAYMTGMALGRHKMTRHSPGKTWEGTVGGALFCVAAAVLLGGMVTGETSANHWFYLCLGFIVTIFGTLGDLVESMFKRYVGVKDSGNLIPGHGGLLDRFDSLLMVLPFATAFVSAYMMAID